MSIEVNWNAQSNTAQMSLIENLVQQIPPSCSTILSDKINVSNFPATTNNTYQFTTEYKQPGSHFIYIPEYNDLFVCSLDQFKTSPYGNVVLVFHDFINPHTLQPHINPANMTELTIDAIPNMSLLSSNTNKPVLTFWQHNYFWLLYGTIGTYTAGAYQPGQLLRYSYDGVKLTKVQTIDIQKLSKYEDAITNNFYGNFSLMDNGYISSQSSKATSAFIHRIVEDTANDTFTVETGEIVITTIFPSIDQYNLSNRINCFYFAQTGKWVYYFYGNSNRLEISFNTNVDESSWSNLISSLNVEANWHEAVNTIMPTTHNYGVFAIRNRKNNKTLVFENPSSGTNGTAYADDVEQLNQTKPWNYVSLYSTCLTPYRIATSNRMIWINLISTNKNIPTSSEPVAGTTDVYDNDYTVLQSYPSPPAWNIADKTRVSWTEDGEHIYSKVVDIGAKMYVPSYGSIDVVDSLYLHSFILDRYYITWVDDETNIMSASNKYGKLAVIDFAPRI